jgi:transcriptional regulator with XRE-family HTH domain
MEKVEFQKLLGKRIQEIRLNKGMTQVDLASKVEGRFDTTNLSRIESGRISTTAYTLYRISKALEIPLEELIKI